MGAVEIAIAGQTDFNGVGSIGIDGSVSTGLTEGNTGLLQDTNASKPVRRRNWARLVL
jgi:hypothetical protein